MAVIGLTAKIEIGNGSGDTEVLYCTKLNFPEIATTKIDTTNLGITDFFKTCIPGMLDPGAVAGECHFSAATYQQLSALQLDRTVTDITITSPEDEELLCTFEGYVSKVGAPFEADALSLMAFEIQPVGAMEVGEGA